MKKTRILALALAIVMVVCALPMAAFAAYEAPNATSVKNVIDNNNGTLVLYVDKTGATLSAAVNPQWTDGNNSGHVIEIVEDDGNGGTKKTQIGNGSTLVVGGTSYPLKNMQNVFDNVTDPVTQTNSVVIRKYNSSAYKLTAGYIQGQEIYVKKTGDTQYTVCEATDDGAVKMKFTKIDDGNNAQNQNTQGKLITNVNEKATISINFRWSGETSIDRLVEPVVSTTGFIGASKISVSDSGVLGAQNGTKTIAQLTSDRYYNLTVEYYVLQDTGAETYSMYYDMYLDGICVAKQLLVGAIKNLTAKQITTHGDGCYGLRYLLTGASAYTNKSDSDTEYFDAVYIRSLYIYRTPNTYVNANIFNSGNSIEDFMPVMDHGEFGIEGYLNLSADMLADANAKVVLMRDSTAVSEVKVSELVADAKGRYKFTLGLDWARVGTEIKIKVTNGTNNYKIYYNGTAYDTLSLFKMAGGVNGSTILEYADFSKTPANAGIQVDGNNGTWNTFMYVFTETGVKLAATTRQNVFYEYTDGENGQVLRIVQYEGSAKQATYKGQNFDENIKTVTISGDHVATYKQGNVVYLNAELNALVEKGTEGAVPAILYENSTKSGANTNLKVAVGTTYVLYNAETQEVTKADKDTPGAVLMAVRSDDSNNGFQSYRSNGTSFLTHDLVISMNFRYSGTGTMDLIIPTMHGSATAGGSGFSEYIRLTPSNKALNVLGTPVAFLDTTRYYDLDAIFSVKETGEDAYTLVCDLYLDGILVYSGKVNNAYTDKPLSAFEGNNTFRYNFIRPASCCNYGQTQTDIIYFKSLKDVLIPNGLYSGEDIATNSGDTIEGYYATLGSKLELNYFLNLLPDVVADPNAEIQFSIDDEVISAQKIADAEPDGDGGYIFTCPVNSTQMASEIKVSIESSTREYKIYMFGEALDSYTYSVAEYANDVLAMMDAMPDETFSAEEKALIKTLVESMLNYGAYAQTYFAAKNDTALGDLANVGCEYTEAELAAANFGTGTITGATTGMTATLVLDTDTVINIYKNGVLVGQSEGITADKLNADVEIDCGDTTVTVSVLTLAGMVPEGNTNFKNLAKALALYSAATEAFEAYVNSQE